VGTLVVVSTCESSSDMLSKSESGDCNDLGNGYEWLFEESGGVSGSPGVSSNSVVDIADSSDPVPVVKEEDFVPVNLVMEDSLVLEPLRESK